MEQQPEVQQPVVQQTTQAVTPPQPLPTRVQRHLALAHPVGLLVAALSLKFADRPFMAGLPNLILFSKGFFTAVFVLILMDVISFVVPHWKKATPIPLFQGLDRPTKVAFWIGVAVVGVEGFMGWLYGWEGKTGWVFGLGALVTGVWYEHGMRKFVQWALD